MLSTITAAIARPVSHSVMIECLGVWELRPLLPDERSGHLSYGSKVKVDYFLYVAHGLSEDLESCLTATPYLIFSPGSPKHWLLHNELDHNGPPSGKT